MKPSELKQARTSRGWSQEDLAQRLHVSQSYVAMLENGTRHFTSHLVKTVARLFNLPPTVLPLSHSFGLKTGADVAQSLAGQLAALGYPGFSYLRGKRKKNPNEVLLCALAQPELEARVVEALPWVLVSYPDVDAHWLVHEAKQRDLQNRVGFVTALARRVAEVKFPDRVPKLAKLETLLDQSRLAKEDTMCKASLGSAETNWLRENRSDEAKHWNLLTDLRPENLAYSA
jgi:transcriptional regulator with XRE-family HTH domain